MHAHVIETRGLTKRYKERAVVDRIELRVERGEIYGFLGLNGAGKTTTIRMLMGLIHPSAGEARIFGRRVPEERLAVMRRVGALVESPSYYAHLSGWENLRVSATLLGVPERRGSPRCSRSADSRRRTGERKVGDYSLGMKQRLGIATALLGSPELVVLDEPTNGLDPAGIHEVRDLIRRMPTEHGITVLVELAPARRGRPDGDGGRRHPQRAAHLPGADRGAARALPRPRPRCRWTAATPRSRCSQRAGLPARRRRGRLAAARLARARGGGARRARARGRRRRRVPRGGGAAHAGGDLPRADGRGGAS